MHNNNLLLSSTIQEIRKFLYSRNFFEKHLYGFSGKITGTFPISTDKGVLRVSPEPDVWIVPKDISQFFFLGSLFRNEEVDDQHYYEFTTADLYIRGGNAGRLIQLFWELIQTLTECALISDISKLEVSAVSFNAFSQSKIVSENETEKWVLVTHYPIEDSFYDAMLDQNVTQKSELFYLIPGHPPVELASLGRVGKNQNPNIKSDNPNLELEQYISEEIFGFCFGIERLLLVSQLHRGESHD
uniref:tRNA synthetases class II (D, K and N) n=1 Tax=Candidatus Kentrum sp. FW TaxID=2126338 RepID=A0A450TA92_9GAMM|nr:MAG: tRNA synthetases class II (D, K and N) [Candidatus Kentron sp. FW]